ncbi:transketolase [Streptomyces rapamycinicus]|uniref:dihydrolipoyllysine-residue succinyltransferase n=2 Tax=Streptomyces rhizosphaericus TaxID=114699 RepID=A0A6G4ASV4_9ACTN|nr:transketolase [Streptomyces rhizosphaericus]
MSIIRKVEDRCLELSKEGFVQGSVHTCQGQEAIPVGAVAALGGADRVLPTYRGHGWAVACGVPLEGLLGEICQRGGGVNAGRGGSAYLSAPQHRLVGENSIVGAGVPIGAGVALAADRAALGGVAVASIGDGAMNQGSVTEGLIFAAINQLPLVVICENNGWAEMTPTAFSSLGEDLSRRGAAFGIRTVSVDGNDPIAVHDEVVAAVAHARGGEGPTLIEARTVRLSGHYNKDIQHYRPREDSEDATSRDPLTRLRDRLLADGVAAEELDAIEAEATRLVDEATAQVKAMPEPDPRTASDHVVGPRPAIGGPVRRAETSGKELTYWKAVNLALSAELAARPEVLVYGEDVAAAGGIFGVTRGLQKQFGEDRVFDTPIAESAILGSAVGSAISGMRPVVEIMWGDFIWVAFDQIINQAANVRYISRGEVTAPMVVRLQQGATPGSCAQHSQSMEAVFAHVPGVKVGVPVTPADAYAMTRAAIADPDPVILVEARALYPGKGAVDQDLPVEEVGGARLHREGGDLAIITWGPMLYRALAAAEVLAAEGVEASVLDLRWLNPVDDEAVADVVRRSNGHVLVAHEANLTGGFGAEIAARITERHFTDLRAAVSRVATPDVRMPAAPILQDAVIPNADTIVAAARDLLGVSADPS